VRPDTLPGRLSWLAAVFVVAFCVLVASVGADARWLAALGGEIARLGTVPAGVPYAAASSLGWHNVPVLGELIFHGLEALAGDRGLVLAQALAVACALGVTAIDMRRSGAADSPAALCLLLAAVASAPALLIVRAQLFSLALFPVLVLLLRDEARSPSRRIWLLVPLTALWSNLHGGVVLGLAVAGCYLVIERTRSQPLVALGVLLGCGAALLATPALLDTLSYYRGVLGSEAAARGEGLWAPLSVSRPMDVAFLVAGAPLLLAALRARSGLWEFVALAGLGAAAVQSGRNGVWLALFAAAPAARALTGSRAWGLAPSQRITMTVGALLAGLVVLGLARAPASAAASPALRAEAVRAADDTPILADDVDAEQLALDGARVWMANPLDAFDHVDQRLYLDWSAGLPSGDALLAQADVVLVKLGSLAFRRVARDRRFREAGHDAGAALFVRYRPARWRSRSSTASSSPGS
jgi:hypothetical protein